MLHKSFNSAKCKTSLKLASSRIKLLRNKRQAHVKALKNDVAQLLQTDQTQAAMIQVEHVTREAKTMAAYDLLAVFCEQIAANVNLVGSQKNCPINLKEAIASVVFAVPRCSDLPELTDVTKQITRKYGKQFTNSILELRPDSGVSRKLVENLSTKTADGPTKVKLLTAIAEEHKIKWVYKAFEDDNAASSSHVTSSFHHVEEQVPHHPPMSQTPSNAEQKPSPVVDNHQERENLGSGKWQKEFKDASEAAQAAADSAELASMAAKAAVELARNQTLGSHVNDKEQAPLERKKSEVIYEEISDEEIIARYNRLKELPQSSNSNVKDSFPPDFDESVIRSDQNSFVSSTSQPAVAEDDTRVLDDPVSVTISGEKDQLLPKWDSFKHVEIETELHQETYASEKANSVTEEEMGDSNGPKFDEYVNEEERTESLFDKDSPLSDEERESKLNQQIFAPEKEEERGDLKNGPSFDEYVDEEESGPEEDESWFDTGKLSGGLRHKPILGPLFTKKTTPLSSLEIDAVTEELLSKEVELPSDSSDDDIPKPQTPPEEAVKEMSLASSDEELPMPKPKPKKTRLKKPGESSRKENFFDSEEDEDERGKAVLTKNNVLKNLPSRRTKHDANPNPAKPRLPSNPEMSPSKRTSRLSSELKNASTNPAESIKPRTTLEGCSSVIGEVANDAVRADKKPSSSLRNDSTKSTPDTERSSSERVPRVSNDVNIYAIKKPASSIRSEAPIPTKSLESIKSIPEKSAFIEKKVPRISQDTNDRTSLGSKKQQSPLRNETTSAPALQESKKSTSSSKGKEVARVSPDKESIKSSSSWKGKEVSPEEQEASRIASAMQNSSVEIGAAKTATQVSSGENLNKKASHVHPKLPDYDDLAKLLRANRS